MEVSVYAHRSSLYRRWLLFDRKPATLSRGTPPGVRSGVILNYLGWVNMAWKPHAKQLRRKHCTQYAHMFINRPRRVRFIGKYSCKFYFMIIIIIMTLASHPYIPSLLLKCVWAQYTKTNDLLERKLNGYCLHVRLWRKCSQKVIYREHAWILCMYMANPFCGTEGTRRWSNGLFQTHVNSRLVSQVRCACVIRA